jgi:hypothetical protein
MVPAFLNSAPDGREWELNICSLVDKHEPEEGEHIPPKFGSHVPYFKASQPRWSIVSQQ